MKKFILTLLPVLIVVSMLCTAVYADETTTIKVTPSKTEVCKGERFQVTLSLENVKSNRKVESVEGYINYDKAVIEEINVSNIHQSNNKVRIGNEELSIEDVTNARSPRNIDSGIIFNGDPASDENDSKIIIDFSDGITSNTDLITIDFVVKSDASLGAKANAITYSMFIITENVDDVPTSLSPITKNINLTVKDAPPPVVLSSISVTTPPAKTSYTEGERFDSTGMVVTATYSDNSRKEVSGYVITPNGDLTTSNRSVTINYTEDGVTKSTTQDITVTKQGSSGSTSTLSNIRITTQPTKTTYTEGDRFDTSGMVIVANYADGTSKTITNYTVTPSGDLTPSNKTITITYTENGTTKSITQNITVTAKAVNNTVNNTVNNNTTKNITNSTNNKNTTKNTSTDNTTAKQNIPATGAKMILIPLVLVGIVAYVSYKKYIKYKDV